MLVLLLVSVITCIYLRTSIQWLLLEAVIHATSGDLAPSLLVADLTMRQKSGQTG